MLKRFPGHSLKKYFRRRLEPGASPGTLQVDPDAPAPAVHAIAYGPDTIVESDLERIEDARELLGSSPVVWVNVAGLGDAALLESASTTFGLHKLALEDVLNVNHRAKVEPYDDHLFMVLRAVSLADELRTDQVSLFLGKDYILTFQESREDCLDPVRDRLRHGRGRIRKLGADYLAYAIVDAVVDHYFPVLETYGLHLEEIEDAILQNPTDAAVEGAHRIKRGLRALRRALWPHREGVNTLLRDPVELVSDETRVYLRDTYDHVVQSMELLENLRELSADLIDLHMSSMSNRMNEVMKVLTIIATIFIPLGFVAGLYGMNFQGDVSPLNMPELKWYFGYPMALLLMALLAAGMLFYFRRKGWIGTGKKP